jgi:hypothetical protein
MAQNENNVPRSANSIMQTLEANDSTAQADGMRVATQRWQIAIPLKVEIDNASEEIYQIIKPYSLIMVGEMHGTKEPAELLVYLVEQSTLHGDSVQVGFEIPIVNMSELASFFATNEDGRGSTAWCNAIEQLSRNPLVKLFFFDNFSDKRDSTMYLLIKDAIIKHPTHQTFTLSGNVHNKMTPHRGEKTMGYYLVHDLDSDKILSISHNYNEGTIYANFGQGTELRTISPRYSHSPYTYEKSMILTGSTENASYNCVYFTQKVSASFPCR